MTPPPAMTRAPPHLNGEEKMCAFDSVFAGEVIEKLNHLKAVREGVAVVDVDRVDAVLTGPA
jgi:hypothetical protein